MSPWSILPTSAFLCGVLLSFVLTIIMTISLAIAPDMWVGDYPTDVKEKFGAMSPRASRLRPYIAVAFFLAALVVPFLGLLAFTTEIAYLPFIPAFIFAFLVFLTFNAYDWLILDWLIFCTLQPRWVILPGTEGMAGYRNYRFHFVGFLKGLAFCGFGGLIVAILWIAVEALLDWAV